MQDYQITSGFSDIKTQFIRKNSSLKVAKDLDLWFTFKNDFLLAHDTEFHNLVLVMAWYNKRNNTWKSFLVKRSLGEKVMAHLLQVLDCQLSQIGDGFNEEYRRSAYRPPGS